MNIFKQLQVMQRLMKDPQFKALMAHPKMQDLLTDRDVQALMKSKDTAKIAAHPKFMALMRDPELAPLLATFNPKQLLA